ncbi:flavin reductase family protein [Arthrobacter sp. MAHUQ-56]
MTRRDFDPAQMSSSDFYQLLTAVVVPRPIAWVSTTSVEGIDNLAPHSFYTVASVNPPIVQFTSVGKKDSLRNIQSQGEFVVNLTPASLFEQVNATGTDFPAAMSEFDAVGLSRESSTVVAPPRVKDSPVALECRLHSTLELGDCTLVFGTVVYAVVSTSVLDGDHPQIGLLEPLSRLGRNEWGTLGSIQELRRIRAKDWPGHFRAAGQGE